MAARIQWLWHTVVATFWFGSAAIVALLNTDLWSAALSARGVSAWILGVYIPILATAELVFWYWFWRWLIWLVGQWGPIQESVKLGKEFTADLKDAGLLVKFKRRVQCRIIKTYLKVVSPGEVSEKLSKAKWATMFGFGIEPLSGGRIIAVIYSAARKQGGCLIPLGIGNFLRAVYVVGFWDLLFRTLSHIF